jgi:hypothetical protein
MTKRSPAAQAKWICDSRQAAVYDKRVMMRRRRMCRGSYWISWFLIA